MNLYIVQVHSTLSNELARTQSNGTNVTHNTIYKQANWIFECIKVFICSKGKILDLPDFDQEKIIVAMRFGTSNLRNGAFGGLFTRSRCENISKVEKWKVHTEKWMRRHPAVCSMSQCTVQSSLLRIGLQSRRPSRVPQAWQWVKKRSKWTMKEWKKPSSLKNPVFTRLGSNTDMALRCTVARIQAVGGGIMVCVMCSWFTLEIILTTEQSLTNVQYMNMWTSLQNRFIPSC